MGSFVRSEREHGDFQLLLLTALSEEKTFKAVQNRKTPLIFGPAATDPCLSVLLSDVCCKGNKRKTMLSLIRPCSATLVFEAYRIMPLAGFPKARFALLANHVLTKAKGTDPNALRAYQLVTIGTLDEGWLV